MFVTNYDDDGRVSGYSFFEIDAVTEDLKAGDTTPINGTKSEKEILSTSPTIFPTPKSAESRENGS